MPLKHTLAIHQKTNQVLPFHAASSKDFVCTLAGIGKAFSSCYK
jgi:hypothetical protein